MATIKILGGDFAALPWTAAVNPAARLLVITATTTPDHFWKGETHKLIVEHVEPITSGNAKSVAGTAAWGLAGAALLGPLGAVGGMLLGGNTTQVSFMCRTADQRSFVGITDGVTYAKLVAATPAAQPAPKQTA